MEATTETSTPTLQSLLDRYFALRILVSESKRRYELSVRNLARYIGDSPTTQPADIELARIDEAALIGFRDWSLARMKAISLNTERRHLFTLFNAAVSYKMMSENPFRLVPGAPAATIRPKSIPRTSMLDYLRFMDTATTLNARGKAVEVLPPQWFWQALLKTLYFTGMRRRQVVGLRWRDVSFKGEFIVLSAVSSKTRREWCVPLAAELRPALLDLRARTIAVVGPSIADRQVFCLPLFSAWSSRYVRGEMGAHNLDAFFKRMQRAVPASFDRLSAHMVRHTTATVLANNVPNLKVVQELLGHSSVSTTMNYIHPDLPTIGRALTVLQPPADASVRRPLQHDNGSAQVD
ncbi:MAG: tyrosine-type recombinase/integrase [Rubrivivax sp.]